MSNVPLILNKHFFLSLNKNVEDEELNSSVFNHFKQWGKLLGVKVLKDWLKRPYAFVQFEVMHGGIYHRCSINNADNDLELINQQPCSS